MPTPTIQINQESVSRSGRIEAIEKERQTSSWPQELQIWIPEELQYSTDGSDAFRWEAHLGSRHPRPLESVQAWWNARLEYWEEQEAQVLPLRNWLKRVEPAHKIDAKQLWLALRDKREALPFLPSKKDILRVLDKPLEIRLRKGFVHGKLNARRVREKGFICWRGAKKNGLRGTDVASFFTPKGQPKDVLLHILKWSWKYHPVRALETLIALKLITPKVEQTQLSVSAHPSILQKDLKTILGCSVGIVSAQDAGKALSRTKSMVLAGVPVQVTCTPSVPKRDDRDFFLPRNRVPEDLFSLWNRGVRLDEEGRYSLTPERMAMDIAKRTPKGIVWDAFCGCGGNAIAFARQTHITKVIATDINKDRLAMARHNAKIYGVENKIDFRCVDMRTMQIKDAFVFVDPPWGPGDEYLQSIRIWFQQNHAKGMIKLPVHLSLPEQVDIRLYCSKEGYPSFMIESWK